MRRLPPLKALQGFEAVAEFDSFTRAARSCGLTHGAISHQIRAVEAWLGRPLFERHAGGVRLNRDGERLRRACSAAFGHIERACADIRAEGAGRSLTVGCPASLLAYWLLPRVEGFARARPGVALSFQTRADYAGLLARRVDALIASGPPPPPPEVVAIRLAGDRIGPVCAPALRDPPRAPGDVGRCALLHAASRLGAWGEWAEAAGARVDVAGGQRLESLSLAIEAAKAGLGVAMAPELLVQRDVAAGLLAAPLGFVPVDRATSLFVAAAAERDADIAAFSAWLVEQVEAEAA